MGKDNRRNRGIFIRLTRKAAIKEIKKQEKRLGRKLEKQEKHKIAKRVAKNAKTKTTIYAIAGMLGIGGIALVNALPSGNEGIPVDKTNISGKVLDDNEFSKGNGRQDFIEGLKVRSQEELIREEIDGLETSEEILAYVKNMYIEEYEKVTGNENLTTEDIEIHNRKQSYAYEIENGEKVVIKSGDPIETEHQLKLDGKDWESIADISVYTVELKGKENIHIIDAVTNDLKQVIPGAKRYSEMKDYESALQNNGMGEVLKYGYEYITKVQHIENGNKDEISIADSEISKKEFINAVVSYEKLKEDKQQAQTGQQVQSNELDMEIGE